MSLLQAGQAPREISGPEEYLSTVEHDGHCRSMENERLSGCRRFYAAVISLPGEAVKMVSTFFDIF